MMPHRQRTSSIDRSATGTASRVAARTPRRCPTDAPPQVDTWAVDAEATFLTWLADPQAPEELFPHGRNEVGLPASWLLGMLCASRTPLPDWAADQLGYRQQRSIGDAATDLLLAVSDPAGPRCPTFAAAKCHLRELDARAHVFDGD